MENTDKNCQEGGRCMGSCPCGYGKGRFFCLLRTLITLIILIIVFWCGFRLGALQSSLRRESRAYSMMGQDNYGNTSGERTGGIMMPYGAGRQGTSTTQ